MKTQVFTARTALSGGVLMAGLVLGGCSFIPTLQTPPAPVADSYPITADGAHPSAQAAAEVPWRQFFTQARTQRLIETALINNRDLRIALLNVEQARALAGVQRADLFPTLNAGATGTRQPGSNDSISSTYTLGLAVSGWELDVWGRIRALSEAAQARYLATEEGSKSARMSLIAAVASADLALQADDELIALTADTLRTREESLKLTQLKFDVGTASALDQQQAVSLIESARATLAQLRRQRAQDENALVLLLGQPLPKDLPAATETQLMDVPAGLPADLLSRRPDIRQAEQTLIAANANIGAARAAFFPRISLTGSFGLASTELSKLISDGNTAWTFAPQAMLPIFDAGRNSANLASAQAGRDIALAQYEKAIQTAFKEVADALAGRATYGEQYRATLAQANAEGERFKLAELRYRNGVASYLDLLDAQRSAFAARQAAVQTRLAQVQNQITLYKVLGGGWSEEAVAAKP